LEPRSIRSALPPTSRPLFSFTDPATSEIYTLSLHDALPIYKRTICSFLLRANFILSTKAFENIVRLPACNSARISTISTFGIGLDRKSTRLNSSHVSISYAVFCLKKKKERDIEHIAHVLHRR